MKNKLCEEFIDEYMKKGTYANRQEIEEIVNPVIDLIKKNQDKSPEEIVSLIVDDDIKLINKVLDETCTPGATIGISAGDINVKLFGGDKDFKGGKLLENAIFDIASMSKIFTQIAVYSLINEKVFSFDDKIKDLDPKFTNLGDLTVRDITTFMVSFKTPGRISDQKSVEDAKKCLYQTEVTKVGEYNYNDIGMIIMKEVMEDVTKVPYEQLVDTFVLKKLNLNDTFVGQIPESERYRFTGSNNLEMGLVNDGNTNALGGISGAAGISMTADDMEKLGRGIHNKDIFPERMVDDFKNAGSKGNRGIAGNTYVLTKKGLADSCVDYISNFGSFALQGSTRVNSVLGKDATTVQFFNPSSMGVEQAREIEKKLNIEREKKGQAPLSTVHEYETLDNGIVIPHTVIDSRQLFPLSNVDNAIKTSTKSAIQLEFVDYVFKKLYNYDENVEVSIDTESKSL